MGVFDESVSTFLSVLKPYLDDDGVSEVLVNGPYEVFVERKGLLARVDAQFVDEQALQAAVRNIAQFVGRRIDDENPILDARLPDGSRVSAVLPPCARKGTSLSIRKFSKAVPTFVDLVGYGTLSKDAARFLDVCVFLGKNIIVSGGTGSGKTTFLNVLGARVPGTQRLLVIEDSTELKITTDHVVFFETRLPDEVGRGEITMRDLMRSALRQRPDRIIVGEVRGAEAFDLITAMNTGHSGSMGTVHANSPYDALVRLETLCLMSGLNLPTGALRRQISAAVHIMVQIRRMPDGSRKVSHISEVLPDVDEQGRYRIQDLFVYAVKGKAADGKYVWEMTATGVIPTFMSEIEFARLPVGRDKFSAPDWYKAAA